VNPLPLLTPAKRQRSRGALEKIVYSNVWTALRRNEQSRQPPTALVITDNTPWPLNKMPLYGGSVKRFKQKMEKLCFARHGGCDTQ
jgi:hypothetical protein